MISRRTRARSLAAALAAALGSAPAAQDDLRDVVELHGGEVRRGRVVQRHAPGDLLLDVGGRRVRVPRAEVVSVRTVGDALAELLALRRPGLSVEADWSLAASAAALGLDAVARLQAWHVLLRDPEHAEAHALLGHRGEPGRRLWRWPGSDDWLPADAFADRARRERFTLESEHFRLTGRGGLRAAVDALFDLERTYAAFRAELGPALHAAEFFAKVDVIVHPSLRDLPKISTTVEEPYCDPSLRGGGVVHTYQEATMARPARLVALAIEQLLYRTLLDPRAGLPPTQEHRIAAWIEVGLGRWFESRASAAPGHVEFGAPKLDPLLAGRVLRYRPYGLHQFVHVPFLAYHDDPGAAPFHVAHATLFVTWLMDEATRAGTPPVALRSRFLAYVRACYADGKGNSSSALDRALGAEVGRVEDLEQPWIAWLERAAGMRAVRQPHVLRPRRSLRDIVVPPVIR